jgi:hypothetical protein
MNEYFVQSEIEYQRQQRLVAASQYRRARGAVRARTVRSRLSAVVAHLRGPVMELPRPRHSAENGSAARAA